MIFLPMALIHGGAALVFALAGNDNMALMQLAGTLIYFALAATGIEKRGRA